MICVNTHSLSGSFTLAYYDLNNFQDELSKWVRVMMKSFPQLVLKAPNLVREEDEETMYTRLDTSITREKPLRIGFISSFFSPQSSIWGNFGMTIRYLQSFPRFQVDMIYYPRDEITEDDKMLSLNPETNIYLSKFNEPSPYSAELHEARSVIANREFDILVYLDLYMTSELHSLALSKLAPIQVYTHGHPVTSGIHRDIMDYFLSWKAAELPDNPQRFYTETLIQIPTNVHMVQEPLSITHSNTPFLYTHTHMTISRYHGNSLHLEQRTERP